MDKGKSSSQFNRATLEQCYVCDSRRMPWVMLHDFSEPVCRCCVNYEGSDRMEAVLEAVRHQKLAHGFAAGERRPIRGFNAASRNGEVQLRATVPPQERPSQAPAGPPGHDKSVPHGPSVPHPPPPPPLVAGAGPTPALDPLPSPVAIRPGVIDFPRPHHPTPFLPSPLEPPTVRPPLMSPAANHAYCQGILAGRLAAASMKRKEGSTGGAGSEESSSPETPLAGPSAGAEDLRATAAPLRLDYASKPPHVLAALETLARCTPFEIRFKKAHSERGRVFAFDAAPKAGAEYELRLYVEYPPGSGHVYTSASGVARQMYQTSMKEQSRPLSSGFKYLEYELRSVQPSSAIAHGPAGASPPEWQLLGDLLPECVRFFKEPVRDDLLPQPQLHPDTANLPKFTISRTLGGGGGPGTPGHAPPSMLLPKKRKAETPTSERATRPNSLSLYVQSSPHHPRPPSDPLSVSPLPGLRAVVDQITPPVEKRSRIGESAVGGGGLSTSSSAISAPPSHSKGEAAPSSHSKGEAAPSSSQERADTATSSARPEAGLSPPAAGPRHTSGAQIDSSPSTTSSASSSGGGGTSSLGSSSSGGGGGGDADMKCHLCCAQLDGAHFVQCPTAGEHRFCFPCSKDSIKQQGAGTEVYCPSGKRCPLSGSTLPWAFMPLEIQQILSTPTTPKWGDRSLKVKRERESPPSGVGSVASVAAATSNGASAPLASKS